MRHLNRITPIPPRQAGRRSDRTLVYCHAVSAILELYLVRLFVPDILLASMQRELQRACRRDHAHGLSRASSRPFRCFRRECALEIVDP